MVWCLQEPGPGLNDEGGPGFFLSLLLDAVFSAEDCSPIPSLPPPLSLIERNVSVVITFLTQRVVHLDGYT